MDDLDPITQKALFRYQVISGYLAADPARGKRRQTLEHLAGKSWMLQSGEAATVKAETIRYWLRLYPRGGFEALKDKPSSDLELTEIADATGIDRGIISRHFSTKSVFTPHTDPTLILTPYVSEEEHKKF
jgi:hypothetical protein